MVKDDQETFGDFDFTKALEFLDLFPYLSDQPIENLESLS
jgi:hypothetical protein